MASPREHVEEIRRKKFSIGGEENPLTEDLHQAVKNLAAELYAKDVHFLMELIQGILQCVSLAFVNAFKSLVEAHREAPAWILPDIFRFLPVEESNYRQLNLFREATRWNLTEEEVIPSKVVVKQKFFHKP